MVPDHRSHAGSGGRTPSRELPHDASASGDAERHPVGGRTSNQMIRRSARLHRRPRWRHSRHVFRRRQPLPRVPLPVLVVAALLTIAALALQGTRGSNSGSGTVAATGPQLAAFSVTAKELSIDQAEAADVPLSGGVAPGALVIEGSATEATEAPTTAAAPAPSPARRSRSRPPLRPRPRRRRRRLRPPPRSWLRPARRLPLPRQRRPPHRRPQHRPRRPRLPSATGLPPGRNPSVSSLSSATSSSARRTQASRPDRTWSRSTRA